MTPSRMAEIREHAAVASTYAEHHRVSGVYIPELLAEVERLQRELADAAPYVEAGRKAAIERAKSEYYNGTCEDCFCCTQAQCAERRCPTNSIGDSVCPCTCD